MDSSKINDSKMGGFKLGKWTVVWEWVLAYKLNSLELNFWFQGRPLLADLSSLINRPIRYMTVYFHLFIRPLWIWPSLRTRLFWHVLYFKTEMIIIVFGDKLS